MTLPKPPLSHRGLREGTEKPAADAAGCEYPDGQALGLVVTGASRFALMRHATMPNISQNTMIT